MSHIAFQAARAAHQAQLQQKLAGVMVERVEQAVAYEYLKRRSADVAVADAELALAIKSIAINKIH